MSMYTKFNISSCHRSQDLIVYARKKGTNRPNNLKKSKQKKKEIFCSTKPFFYYSLSIFLFSLSFSIYLFRTHLIA